MRLSIISVLLAGVALMSSCSDDITSPVLDLRQSATLHELQTSDIKITKENAAQEFPEISWERADYGKGAVVNYAVYLTNSNTGKKSLLGETGDTKLRFSNSEMNGILAQLGAYPGVSNEYVITLTSHAFDAPEDAAVNEIKFKASVYDPNVDNITWPFAYVAVGYPDWDFTNAYLIGDPDEDGVYQGWVKVDNPSSYAILKGDDLTQVLATGGVGEASQGFFEITLKADGTITQSSSYNSWGLIGDATSGGWDSDIDMEFDESTRLWTVVTSLSSGEFKFRANDDWTISYGGDDSNSGALVAGGSNLKVTQSSPYIVTMDLTHAGKYQYSLEETTIELSSAFMTLPGSYQGWSPEADDCYKVVSEARDFKYTGAYYFESGTEFKFYDSGSWMGVVGDVQWDESHSSCSFAIGDGQNVVVDESAYYKITADTKKMTASMAKTGWEIIGDATPDGWDKGQLMAYNPDSQTWSITLELTDGTVKFRWDASWTINLGGDLNALTQDGADIRVSAGVYDIVLDAINNKASLTAR